jgi:tRNA threonylcarbamoyladenosine biosynthesis protein TsaE
MPIDISLPDTAATAALGEALAAGAAAGRVLHLRGELGAGKTTLIRGLLRALGYAGRVKSPTYTLVEPYDLSSLHFYHFDFYRFKDRSEWLSSGFRDYFNPQAFCAVEWPEKAGELLGAPDVDVHLQFAGESRKASLASHTAAGASWLDSLRFSSS